MRIPRKSVLFGIPAGVFAILALLLGFGLGNDPGEIPSVLMGKPLPAFTLPTLDAQASGLATDNLIAGQVSVINIFASWCLPCRVEHPLLAEIAKREGVALYGIAYKDEAEDTRRFLDELGNPFQRIGADTDGRTGIELGIYGVPETFFIGPDGIVRYKHIGPILPEHMNDRIWPLIEKLLS